MFYSTDLLKRKTPLGAIWIAAHGKKLARGRIMQVNISETCAQIMDPEVPHALRLQAILASGVCIVYNRQSEFLLNDIQSALRSLTAATQVDHTANLDVALARSRDIDMDADDLNLVAAEAAFPNTVGGGATPFMVRNGLDDFVQMPSIPEATDGRSVPSPAARDPQQEDLVIMHSMELVDGIMDAPQGLDQAFEFMQAPGDDGFFPPDAMFGDALPLPMEEPSVPAPEEEQPGEGAGAPAAPRRAAHRRLKKPLVDCLEELTIPTQVYDYATSSQGREDLLVLRPRVAPAAAGGPGLFALGPATGPWPAELAALWERCNAGGAKPARVRTPPGEEGEERRRSKRARLNLDEEEPALPHLQEDFLPVPMDDYFVPPPQDDYYAAVAEGGEFGAAAGYGRPSGSESGGVEAERLRAALHGTPGGGSDYKDAMFQLGLTPSDDGRRRGRFSAGTSRRESSRGGRLSEKSSGRESLQDALEELQAATEQPLGDAAAALPVVGEKEDGGVGSGRGRPAGVSQISLLEESGPTGPGSEAAATPAAEHAQTLQILASLRSFTATKELSLDHALKSMRLSRLDAARVFAHVLVGKAKGFVGVEQEAPFADITLNFAG